MVDFKNNDPSSPLSREPDGTYITVGQAQFFFNREDGKEKFENGHEDFFEYYNLCRVYNLVSDIMKKEPEAAIMYWDDKREIVSVGFPTQGTVAKALARMQEAGIFYKKDEDFKEDVDFDSFGGRPWNDG